MNDEALELHWSRFREKLADRYHVLSDHDFREAEGDSDYLVGILADKTGRSRSEIEQELDALFAETNPALLYADKAAAAARDGYESLSEEAAAQFAEAERLFRENPVPTIAATFGVGLLVGVAFGLTFRGR